MQWRRIFLNSRIGFMGVENVRLHQAYAQKGPVLGLMLCCPHLETLDNIVFEFVLRGWSDGIVEPVWVQWALRKCFLLSLCCPMGMLVDPDAWESRLVCFIYDWLSSTYSPDRPCFLFEPELTLTAESRQQHSKGCELPQSPDTPFLFLGL